MIKGKTTYSNDEENFSKPDQRLLRKDSWLTAKDLSSSFKYAVQGLLYNLLTQRNFRIHIFISVVVSILAIWLNLSFDDFAIIVLTIGAVLVLELINTSIEAVVDLSIGKHFHSLARIAKDSAAAAVLVASLCSVLIAALLILPPLLHRLHL